MYKFNKDMRIDHNVQFRIFDKTTGALVKVYEGHNAATNTMLTGIAHYLSGDGVLNQGYEMLSNFVPRYISLGTMGLINQEEEFTEQEGEQVNTHLPAGICGYGAEEQGEEETDDEYEARRFTAYMQQVPSYGSDGYYTTSSLDNNRLYLGLGHDFAHRPDQTRTINCELISASFPRAKISYRAINPEQLAETPETVDIVFSAMISMGALAQFREPGKDYVFITEAGLWSSPIYNDEKLGRGLLAGYRIVPPNETDWDMNVKANRDLLKQQVIRVGVNQVVQVMWKVQIGSLHQLQSRVYDTSIYIGKGEE